MSEKNVADMRMFAYTAEVLNGQQHDPLCRECLSYGKVLEFLKEGRSSLSTDGVPEGMKGLLENIDSTLGNISMPEEPKPQRKLGNCRLPGRRCMVKHARAIFKWADEQPGG